MIRRKPRRDLGRVNVLLATLTVAVLAVAGTSVDGGLALAGKKHAYSVAADAARTGAQQIDLATYRGGGPPLLDPAAAHNAAAARLDLLGVTGEVSATTTEVSVTVWHTQPTQLWALVGVEQVTVSSTATAQVRHGVTSPGDVP